MKKDLIVQLEASKLSIKDLLSDLLNETKGFKNQFTVNVLLKKYKLNGEIEFAPVYFNSTTETVINHRFKLETSFQDILYLKNNWINEGSCWIVEPIESQYINISTYRSLSGSSYIRLPEEFKNPRKRLINIKNKNQKCFYGVMLGILILQKNIQKKLENLIKYLLSILLIQKKFNKKIKSLLVILIMIKLNFQCKKKILARLRGKTIFGYENELIFSIYVSDQKFKESMDFFHLIDDNKSHYVYIKAFNRFIVHKTKKKIQKYFYKSCLQWFTSKNVLIQSLKLEKGIIKFENYFKQIPFPFKTYADFECNLRGVESYEGSYTKKI